MSLNYVTVTGTFDDGSGAGLGGTIVFTPSQAVYASGVPLVMPGTPIVAVVSEGTLSQRLLATDNSVSYESSTGFWFWTVSFNIAGAQLPSFSFYLPSSPSTVDLWSLANTAAGSMPPPSGAVAAGDVPIATGAGSASTWGPGPATVQTVTATVSPIGTAAGASLPNNGADYGPDTPGTTTSGVQEALTALESTGGKILLRQGAFQIDSAMTYTSDYSLTIEGETRGRAENVSSSATDAYGVFLMVNTLGAGVVPLTIAINTGNLGMLRLTNFTMRGQPLGYTGTSTAGMLGIALKSGLTAGSPAQVEIDNVACEFLSAPCINIENGTDGPVIIDWVGFFYCGNYAYETAMLQLTTATCHIGHIEAFVGGTAALGVTGVPGQYSYIDVDSIFAGGCRVFNFGCNGTAQDTYLHIGHAASHNNGDGLISLNATGDSSLFAQVDKASFVSTSPPQGYVIEGLYNSTTGPVQVTIGSLVGCPQYLVNNAHSQTVGAGSFLDILSAYYTQTPSEDVPFANLTTTVRPAGSQLVSTSELASDNGLLVETFDLAAATSSVVLTAGNVYLFKLMIRENMTISNLWFAGQASGAGASSGTYVGLYSSSGTLLSGSADVGTQFTNTGGIKCALTTPQYIAAGTFVWAALVVNLATTQPSLYRGVPNGGAANLGLSAAAYRFCVNGTTQTSLPATITPASNTTSGAQTLWVGAS